MKNIIAMMMAMVMTGCYAPARLPANTPAAYQAGYGDGCRSVRGRFVKNFNAYAVDTLYQNGWDDAMKICVNNRRNGGVGLSIGLGHGIFGHHRYR